MTQRGTNPKKEKQTNPTTSFDKLYQRREKDLQVIPSFSLMCPSFARQTTFGHPTVLAHPAIFHAFLSRDRFLELRHTKPSQFQAILELFDFAIAYFLHFVLIVFQFPFIIASTSSFLFCSEKYCVSTLPFLVDFPTSFHWSSPLTIIAYHLRLSCYPCAQPTQSTISCNPMVREIHTHNAHRILNQRHIDLFSIFLQASWWIFFLFSQVNSIYCHR